MSYYRGQDQYGRSGSGSSNFQRSADGYVQVHTEGSSKECEAGYVQVSICKPPKSKDHDCFRYGGKVYHCYDIPSDVIMERRSEIWKATSAIQHAKEQGEF